jgi:hypothetical protein
VVDQRADGGEDRRLIARLADDEPDENPGIVARIYLADPTRGRCAPLTGENPFPAQTQGEEDTSAAPAWASPVDVGDGTSFRLGYQRGARGAVNLRWAQSGADVPVPVSLRRVVGTLEAYEPALSMTRAALEAHRGRSDIATRLLAGELTRLTQSPIVLNRLLRERVQRALAGGELTMSEIAARCGRTKRDPRGNASGETSWLARRIGVMAEAGEATPTPWVHSDVLALIARDGLGIAPNEAESS